MAYAPKHACFAALYVYIYANGKQQNELRNFMGDYLSTRIFSVFFWFALSFARALLVTTLILVIVYIGKSNQYKSTFER